MRTLALVLAVGAASPYCFAQTKTTTTPMSKPVACQTLVKCRAELKRANDAANQLADTVAALTTERDKLAAANKDIESSHAKIAARLDGTTAMLKVLDKEMRFVPITDDDNKSFAVLNGDNILDLGIAIEKDKNEYISAVQQLSGENDSAVRKYNALLSDYKDYVTRVGIQLAAIGQTNRINNALALYNAMPRYTPPAQVNVQVSDCTRLPALCVH